MAMACVLACASCNRKGEASVVPVPATDAVPTAVPETRDVVIAREYVADVRAARHAEIRSWHPGIIRAVSVVEAQSVTEGQLLFTIQPRSSEYDQRAADPVEILAPMDGVVDQIAFRAGSAVDESRVLATISDRREIFAHFAVADREYRRLVKPDARAAPTRVRLLLADGSLHAPEGTIDSVTSENGAPTGSIAYRARFANPEGGVTHGSRARVVLETRVGSTLVVPPQATFEVQGEVYVYTVDDGQVARARKIAVRERLDDLFVIESGLEPSDRFVAESVETIEDGARLVTR